MDSPLKQISSDAVDFYPTPPELAEKILECLDLDYIQTVLEPSAGTGNLLRPLAQKEYVQGYRSRTFDVDCIEVDPNLRQILKHSFGGRKGEIKNEINRIKEKYKYCEERWKVGYVYFNGTEYVPLPESDKRKIKALEAELTSFFENGIHIVHDDFLTFRTNKQYDLILMNPPFSSGAKHLLKALKMQENGGNIICILNAETIKNPYSAERKDLVRLLDEYGAQIEYISDAFKGAERKTDVEIAVVRVSIPDKVEESDIYTRLKKAEQMRDFDPTMTDIAVTDYIKAAVAQFRVESSAGVELIRQYRAMVPYMACRFGTDTYDKSPILRLTDSTDRGYDSVSVNQYLRRVRMKYWNALLSNPKFTSKLTSKLQEEYRSRVEKLADYDFTEFNILDLTVEMNAQIKTGIENEIITMFDTLTEEHSYYPECSKNRHYYDGWKTNKAHKIDKKVIIPAYGVFDSWDGKPRTYEARGALEDIERILNYLDGGMTREVDLWQNLEICFQRGETKNIELKYFKATFYKKGTIHLVFKCPELIERFNIYAAQQKKWLPPNYGRKAYHDMTQEEQQVIDSFQGAEAYAEIMAKSNYYLKPVTNDSVLMIGG